MICHLTRRRSVPRRVWPERLLAIAVPAQVFVPFPFLLGEKGSQLDSKDFHFFDFLEIISWAIFLVN